MTDVYDDHPPADMRPTVQAPPQPEDAPPVQAESSDVNLNVQVEDTLPLSENPEEEGMVLEEAATAAAEPAPKPRALPADSLLILFYGEDEQQTIDAIKKRSAFLGGDEAMEAQATEEPNGYDHLLYQSVLPNPEAKATQDRIKQILDAGGQLRQALKGEDGTTILGTLYTKPKPPSSPLRVSGKEGIAAFRQHSKRGSLRRIPLYNSGFYIDLVGPSAPDLNNFIEQSDVSADEFGRMMGAIFYTHLDHYLKEAAFRLFRPLITYASITNWDNRNVLGNNIRLEDYDVILMAVAALMYPQGFKAFRHVCHNTPHCSHVTQANVDLTKMVYTDFSKLNKDAIAHMRKAATQEVTAQEVADYQKLIPFVEGSLDNPAATQNVVRWGRYGFVLQSPNYQGYISAGARYLEVIVDGINRTDAEAVHQAVRYRVLRQMAPWIAEIRAYASEAPDAKLELSTSDPATVADLLDDIQTEDYDDQVFALIDKHIDGHKISHVGYPVFDCPACGHKPNIPSGFFTVEPMETFFTMCARKLARKE